MKQRRLGQAFIFTFIFSSIQAVWVLNSLVFKTSYFYFCEMYNLFTNWKQHAAKHKLYLLS